MKTSDWPVCVRYSWEFGACEYGKHGELCCM